RVAERAADGGEGPRAPQLGGRSGGGHRWREKAGEGCEADRVAGHLGRGPGERAAVRAQVGGVFRRRVEVAAGRDGALAREQLAGDALLDVVGLAGKDEERLVLRLPAEAGDGPVVAVMVEPAADAERPPRGGGR